MASLLLADQHEGQLSDHTSRALTAARAIDPQVDILVVGVGAAAAAKQAATLSGVRKVLLADAPAYDHSLAEPLAELIVSLAAEYGALVAAATASGKNVMPRVAALLDVAQVSEIVEVVTPDTFKRMIYAGSVVQTVRARDARRVITVRTTAFAATPGGHDAPIVGVGAVDGSGISAFVSESLTTSERPELAGAKIVVSGGRGLGSKEDFARLILPLADKLGAAVGASRAAVDAGYVPNDWQVGQTGKVVAPELYVAVGISGAIQHVAGMKDSRVIVAINKDPEAPIFQVADYGLVGDLFELLPELDKYL